MERNRLMVHCRDPGLDPVAEADLADDRNTLRSLRTNKSPGFERDRSRPVPFFCPGLEPQHPGAYATPARLTNSSNRLVICTLDDLFKRDFRERAEEWLSGEFIAGDVR